MRFNRLRLPRLPRFRLGFLTKHWFARYSDAPIAIRGIYLVAIIVIISMAAGYKSCDGATELSIQQTEEADTTAECMKKFHDFNQCKVLNYYIEKLDHPRR